MYSLRTKKWYLAVQTEESHNVHMDSQQVSSELLTLHCHQSFFTMVTVTQTATLRHITWNDFWRLSSFSRFFAIRYIYPWITIRNKAIIESDDETTMVKHGSVSIVVSIPACHVGDLGSIPRRSGASPSSTMEAVTIAQSFWLFHCFSFAHHLLSGPFCSMALLARASRKLEQLQVRVFRILTRMIDTWLRSPRWSKSGPGYVY